MHQEGDVISNNIMYDITILYMISCLISGMISQVDEAEKALKMKIRPIKAFLKCYKLELLSALPREELHQFLLGLYGEYIICVCVQWFAQGGFPGIFQHV